MEMPQPETAAPNQASLSPPITAPRRRSYPLENRIFEPIIRLIHYLRVHGIAATAIRIRTGLKRTLTQGRLVVYYCDLAPTHLHLPESDPSWRLERKRSKSELTAQDLAQISRVGPSKLIERQIAERFALGASLWLAKVEGNVAGFGWSLRGSSIETHFLPLTGNDVHFFDFHVFDEYRGRRINVGLVKAMISKLASEANGRVYMEAAEWNTPQLKSISRMPLKKLGIASKYHFGTKTVVIWSDPSRP